MRLDCLAAFLYEIEGNKMNFKVELDNGRYTYIFDNGRQTALRYGEEWRNLNGDKLVYFMASEIDKQKEQIEILKSALIDKGVDVPCLKTSWD